MDWVIIGIAGFLGGMLNAVAGGGSFITLPALIFVGVTPVSANATGTAALLPGYLASAWRFRRDVEFPANLKFRHIAFIAVSGGCLGAAILLMTSEQLFSTQIPWLILLATAAFIVGPWLLEKKFFNKKIRTALRNNRFKDLHSLFGITCDLRVRRLFQWRVRNHITRYIGYNGPNQPSWHERT